MSCDWKGKLVSSPSSSPTDVQFPIIIPPLEKDQSVLVECGSSQSDRDKFTSHLL